MFVLRTGLQGNGKTLNSIIEVDKLAAAQGRVVYYHNIREFKPDHPAITAEWIEFDNPHEWFKLPQNAIILIDEAQTFFRLRPQGSKVPEYASALETMRHQGHELHCITQNPGLIDAHFRKLCNSHIHYVRGHKGPVIKRWSFERVNMLVEKQNDFSDGESTRLLIDKTYFGCYKSVSDGATHHFKFRPPRALLVLIACVIIIGGLSYRFYTNRIAPTVPVAETIAPESSVPAVGSVSTGIIQRDQALPLTPEQYIDSRIPRIPDVPSSAPIYDDLTKPVSYPKPFCMSTSDESMVQRNTLKMTIGYKAGKLHGCRCNSQQGTRLDISFNGCMAYVEHGAFDPAKPDQMPMAGGVGAGASEARGATVQTPPEPSSIQLTHIPDNSRMPRTFK